jgi:hypothetical protein
VANWLAAWDRRTIGSIRKIVRKSAYRRAARPLLSYMAELAPMPMSDYPVLHTDDSRLAVAGLQPTFQVRSLHLNCGHCEHPLECVEQNRRSGTWLGSFICPACRSEYFYAYRWGRLVRKT